MNSSVTDNEKDSKSIENTSVIRRHRNRTHYITFGLVSSLIIFIFFIVGLKTGYVDSEFLLILLSVSITFLVLPFFFLNYLQTPSFNREQNFSFDNEQKKMKEELCLLNSKIGSLIEQSEFKTQSTSIWTETERENIVESIRDNIAQSLSSNFMQSVEERYGAEILERKNHSEINQIFINSKVRILNEIDALTNRSNINLLIGITTTVIAISLLAFVVLSDTINSTELNVVLIHFLPRLSIVVFVEFFSYFFLKLYKTGLNDIKYYQNELTNIESRYVALAAIMGSNISEQAQSVLNIFASTDRNCGIDRVQSVESKQNVTTKDLEGVIGKISDLMGKVT